MEMFIFKFDRGGGLLLSQLILSTSFYLVSVDPTPPTFPSSSLKTLIESHIFYSAHNLRFSAFIPQIYVFIGQLHLKNHDNRKTVYL